MSNLIIIKKRIGKYNKTILVPGDKSISIRWVLFASLANGTSKSNNLLMSEDVIAALNAIKKLGIKISLKNNRCKIYGKGIDGYKYKKNIKINEKIQAPLEDCCLIIDKFYSQ